MNKIIKYSQLADIRKLYREKKIAHCHGVFDLLHPGHIRHLEAAKKEADILVVTVTADKYVNKGPGRPVFNHHLRAESLAALKCVDYVAINEWPTAVKALGLLRPDVYVKGSEYANRKKDITGKIYEEEQAVIKAGGRIHFTEGITFSSSSLINNYLDVFPQETKEWLSAFRKKHSIEEVLGYLKALRKMKVLVIGEAIIDEYVFCDGLGKSNKDPILAFKYHFTETYAGGSLAIANHAASLSCEVGLITLLGERESRENFIRKKLAKNIKPYFIRHSDAPTIHKRRFVDTHTNSRMFEIYLMNDQPVSPDDEKRLLKKISEVIKDYDAVIVSDYGHGMMTSAVIKLICKSARFLAVNTQTNAGNRGFNTISKYCKADYVCLTGIEVALETRMRHASFKDLLMEVKKHIKCPNFTVTLGKEGSLHYSPKSGFTEVPAFATRVVDRVGAGDAVLAVTSLLVVNKTPWDVVGLIGNAVGAEMVAELGNRISIDKVSLSKHLTSLLK